jgi:hypothetical protein
MAMVMAPTSLTMGSQPGRLQPVHFHPEQHDGGGGGGDGMREARHDLLMVTREETGGRSVTLKTHPR